MMINLKKEELILFLHKIKEDPKHFNKYLFYKLQYFYGRRIQEIVLLKVEDIDFTKKEITFNLAKKKQDTQITLILPDDIIDDLSKIINDSSLKEGYIFVNSNDEVDSFKRNMRTYLERNSNKLIKSLTGKDLTLNTHDFR